MDFGDVNGGLGDEQKPRPLPSDLPKSLDDRSHRPRELVPETEMYDGWQGKSPFPLPLPLPVPVPVPLYPRETLACNS